MAALLASGVGQLSQNILREVLSGGPDAARLALQHDFKGRQFGQSFRPAQSADVVIESAEREN